MMRGRQRWAVVLALTALIGMAAPDLVWGLVAAAAAVLAVTLMAPAGVRSRLLPLGLVLFAVAAVAWLGTHGSPV